MRIIDTETMKTEEYFAKIVFLNASTINTAFVLLNSVSEAFPDGFGNSSGQVGHNLMDHHLGIGANGKMEGLEDEYYYGRRPNISYIPRFRNISPQTKHPDFIRGYVLRDGGAGRSGWGPRRWCCHRCRFKSGINRAGLLVI